MPETVDLELLDAFLLSDRAPDNGMGLSDLDGFLSGLVVGPETILPSEWLPYVWGGEEPEFADMAEASAVMRAIMGRYNEIAVQLDEDPKAYEPIFWTRPGNEAPIAADWAEGFFDAIQLRPEAWGPLIEHKEAGVLLAPILGLCSNEQGETLLPMTKEEEAQWRVEAPDLIPDSVVLIHSFWRELAADWSVVSEPIRHGPKIGRNELCPCGSGRKHRRCCGAN